MPVGRYRNVNNVPRFESILRQLRSKTLKIGIFGSPGSDILMIASVNEFGVSINVTEKMRKYLDVTGLHLKKDTTQINIPERNYIRGSFDEKQRDIRRLIEVDLDRLLHFEITISQFYNRTGQRLAQITQEYLTDLREPPNHPYTLSKKTPKSNPLINTGRLRESITWEVD